MNNYFYIDETGSQHGPLSVEHFVEKQCLHPGTMVWNNTFTEWRRADSVEELRGSIASNGVDIPPPYSQNANTTADTNQSHSGRYQQQQSYQQQKPLFKPETWLVWNILVTILCCSIISGIIGIIYSNKVDTYWSMGQYDEANQAASVAKTMFFLSLGLSIFGSIAYVAFMGIAGIGMLSPFMLG